LVLRDLGIWRDDRIIPGCLPLVLVALLVLLVLYALLPFFVLHLLALLPFLALLPLLILQLTDSILLFPRWSLSALCRRSLLMP
jgi:hypothetical protein